MNISEIANKFNAGDYSVGVSDIPKKLPETHIFDPKLSVEHNYKKVLEHNDLVDHLKKERFKKQNELYWQFTKDVIDYLVDNYNINRAQAAQVESFVYKEKHAFMSDYFAAIDEYAEFAEYLVNSKEAH